MPATIYRADPHTRQEERLLAVVGEMRLMADKTAAEGETARRRMRKAVEALRRKRRE